MKPTFTTAGTDILRAVTLPYEVNPVEFGPEFSKEGKDHILLGSIPAFCITDLTGDHVRTLYFATLGHVDLLLKDVAAKQFVSSSLEDQLTLVEQLARTIQMAHWLQKAFGEYLSFD